VTDQGNIGYQPLADRLASVERWTEDLPGSYLRVRYVDGPAAEVTWSPPKLPDEYQLVLTETARGMVITWFTRGATGGTAVLVTGGYTPLRYIQEKLDSDTPADVEAILFLLKLMGHVTTIDYPLGYTPTFEMKH